MDKFQKYPLGTLICCTSITKQQFLGIIKDWDSKNKQYTLLWIDGGYTIKGYHQDQLEYSNEFGHGFKVIFVPK